MEKYLLLGKIDVDHADVETTPRHWTDMALRNFPAELPRALDISAMHTVNLCRAVLADFHERRTGKRVHPAILAQYKDRIDYTDLRICLGDIPLWAQRSVVRWFRKQNIHIAVPLKYELEGATHHNLVAVEWANNEVVNSEGVTVTA